MKSRTRSQVVMRRAVEPWFLTFTLIAFTTTGIVPILMPLYVSQIEHSAFDVGLILSAIGAGMLTAPIWGKAAGRWGCYRLLGSGGAFAVCISMLGISNVQNMPLWCGLSFLMGCGIAAAFTVSNLLILTNHPAYEADARIGWLQTFVTVGTVAGLAAAGLVAKLPMHFGLALGAFTCGVAALIGFAAMQGARFSPTQLDLTAAKHSSTVISPRMLQSMKSAMQSDRMKTAEPTAPQAASGRPLMALLCAWVLANIGFNGFNALYPLLMRTQFNVAPSDSSFVLSAATAASALLYVASSRMTHVLGGRRVFTWGLMSRAAAFAGIYALAFSGVAQRGAIALFLAALATVVTPLLGVSSTIFAAELSSDKGAALGVYNGATALAGLVGPIIGGRLADTAGYESVILLALAGIVAAVMLTRFLPAKKRPAPPPPPGSEPLGVDRGDAQSSAMSAPHSAG